MCIRRMHVAERPLHERWEYERFSGRKVFIFAVLIVRQDSCRFCDRPVRK